MKLLVINGPNLNFLGIREPEIYGLESYEALLEKIRSCAQEKGCSVDCFQSNHEGAIIDRLQEAYRDGTEGIIINPGAFTHYSYAIHDALKGLPGIPKAEVHLSDITAREEFRATSVTSPACDYFLYGKGADGYSEAMDLLLAYRDK